MLKKLLITLSLTQILGGLWAANPTLTQAMVDLDKAYIPALALTGQEGDTPKTQKAMATFVKVWAQFQTNWVSAPGLDAGWKADLKTIQAMVTESQGYMDKHDAAAAHTALEGVRTTLLSARERNKISYYLDTYTRFHTAMEEVLGLESATDTAKFKDEWIVARQLWKAAQPTTDALNPFGLSEASAKALRAQWADLDKLLAGEPDAVKAGGMKPLFTKALFAFGAFPQ